jgi:hypothetical protein
MLAKCIIFFGFRQGHFVSKELSKKLKKFSFDWKLEGPVPFLMVERDGRVTNPLLTPIISPNTSNENF